MASRMMVHDVTTRVTTEAAEAKPLPEVTCMHAAAGGLLWMGHSTGHVR